MKINYRNTGFVTSACILALISLFILSYTKYDLNGLSLANYKFDYIGNVLNIMMFGLIILGCLGIGFTKNPIDKKRLTFIKTLLMLVILINISAYIITKYELIAGSGYIFNIAFKKAVTGFLFIVSNIITLYVIIYVWGIIYGIEKLFELRTLVRTLMASVLLFLFALFYVWNVNSYSEERIENKKYKYGLIPGAAVYSKGKPSPVFSARIRKSFELAKINTVEKLVLTGGKAPGEITEAEAAMKYLIDLGIKPNRLIVENETSTTVEQIKFIKNELFEKELSSEVLIISDGFHLSRSIQICKFFGVQATGVSSNYKLSFEKTLFYRTRESVALLLFWFFAI